MQHDDCGNNAEQTEQRKDWCNESEADLIMKLVVLPKLAPAGNASGQRASRNKQQRNQNEPAKECYLGGKQEQSKRLQRRQSLRRAATKVQWFCSVAEARRNSRWQHAAAETPVKPRALATE